MNWSEKYKTFCTARSGTYLDAQRKKWLRVGERTGVISFKEGYVLVGCSVTLNPQYYFSTCYFTSKKLAREFKTEFYSNALYSVGLLSAERDGE